jgi:hypothetical protein
VSDDDRLIRALVQNWALWRDAGDWERFGTVWHKDVVMMATWFQGSANEFIRVSREGFERGVSILHFLGGTSTESLDAERLARFPPGYRHLGYVQSAIGFEVKRDMPGLTGPAVEDLYRRGARWLAGGDLENPLPAS